jgi:hypothetical protein
MSPELRTTLEEILEGYKNLSPDDDIPDQFLSGICMAIRVQVDNYSREYGRKVENEFYELFTADYPFSLFGWPRAAEMDGLPIDDVLEECIKPRIDYITELLERY